MPVHSAAKPTGPRSSPGRAYCERKDSSASHPAEADPARGPKPKPSHMAHAADRMATTPTLTAVIGSAWESSGPSALAPLMSETLLWAAARASTASSPSPSPIIRSIIQKEDPNPTAWPAAHRSPVCSPPASTSVVSAPSSRKARPSSVSDAAIHTCGAARSRRSRPLKMASRAGTHTTVRAPRKATLAAGVSTSAMD
eukprot:scaffold21688_cov31-Tisochrysis_lutea.AAC.3